jgi:biotin carboxyl carrier protein
VRGKDLATNLEFHYGLVHWFIGNGINARPSTRFIVPYLTAVGLLKEQANQIDLDVAYAELRQRYIGAASDNAPAWAAALDAKKLLMIRPLERLFAEPHYMAGWLSMNKDSLRIDNGEIKWAVNPIQVLEELYHYLNMDFEADKPARYMIWDHDHDILSAAVSFYKTLNEKVDAADFPALEALLASDKAPKGFSADEWSAVRSSHIGYFAGSEVLSVLAYIADKTGFYELSMNADLSITIPDRLTDEVLQKRMTKVLVPPPAAKSDEVLAASGGMYYPREAPGMDVFISAGEHFDAGDTLYIVEVMKMFNKVIAPFAGTIDKVLIEGDGVIIKKGQPLFKIIPDEKIVVETPEEIAEARRAKTIEFLATLN